jgi:hypothetical protein
MRSLQIEEVVEIHDKLGFILCVKSFIIDKNCGDSTDDTNFPRVDLLKAIKE